MSNLDECPLCQEGWPRFRSINGKVSHEVCGITFLCSDQVMATLAEKREELRNEIAASGDC